MHNIYIIGGNIIIIQLVAVFKGLMIKIDMSTLKQDYKFTAAACP